MTMLEERLVMEDEKPEANFEDMWDTVSCDVSTAIEFERTKLKKNHEKEKKRQRREQEKEEKANTARRLRLFERRHEKEGEHETKKAQSRLTDEFIDAIHKVFDDGSVNSGASDSDHDASEGDRRDDLSAVGSCKSLYLGGDNDPEYESDGSYSDPGAELGESGNKNKQADDERDVKSKNGKMRGGRSESLSPKKKKKRAKKTRSSRNEIDASEIFLAEVRRLKKPKVLTIQSLRQEMSDRRGTSVNLLQKEYITYRKKRNDVRRKSHGENDLQQLDFGALSAQKGLSFPAASPPKDPVDADDSETNPAPQSDGIEAKLSRWIQAEGVSDLDDLATVVESVAPTVNILGKNAVGHDIPKDITKKSRDSGSTTHSTDGNKAFTVGQVPADKDPQSGTKLSSGFSGQPASGGIFGMGKSATGQNTKATEPALPPMALPTLAEIPETPDDTMNMFNASFSAMPLSSIQEDDDDDFGLLASHSKDRDSDDEDNFSFQSSRSKRSAGGSGGGNNGNRFKMGKLGKIKGPKLGAMKKLVPKLPSMPKRDARGKSLGGFMMSDDG